MKPEKTQPGTRYKDMDRNRIEIIEKENKEQKRDKKNI